MYGTSSTVNRAFFWITARFFKMGTTKYHPLLGQLEKKSTALILFASELRFKDIFFSLRKASTIFAFSAEKAKYFRVKTARCNFYQVISLKTI